ncbi:hypothetical protein LBMAG53_08870 [Planctomycetota bacterium]|nr:hypothetical protein LBMAG53_08870 [Planctomycetota bacterium]
MLLSPQPDAAQDVAPTIIAVDGVIDQVRAEHAATRLRSAVRNGKNRLTLVFADDAVVASSSFVAFLLRAAEQLQAAGGRLEIEGLPSEIAHLKALGLTSTPAKAGVK